jgi:hypothetical protein
MRAAAGRYADRAEVNAFCVLKQDRSIPAEQIVSYSVDGGHDRPAEFVITGDQTISITI